MTYFLGAFMVLGSAFVASQSRSGDTGPALFLLGVGLGVVIGGWLG